MFDFADSVNIFTFKTSEVYEALIFDLLEKSYEGEECHNVIFDAIDMLGKSVNEVSPYYKLFNSIASSISNTADVIRNLHVENWHTSNLTVEQLMNLDRIKQLSDGFTNEPLMKNLGLFIKEAKRIIPNLSLRLGTPPPIPMANVIGVGREQPPAVIPPPMCFGQEYLRPARSRVNVFAFVIIAIQPSQNLFLPSATLTGTTTANATAAV